MRTKSFRSERLGRTMGVVPKKYYPAMKERTIRIYPFFRSNKESV